VSEPEEMSCNLTPRRSALGPLSRRTALGLAGCVGAAAVFQLGSTGQSVGAQTASSPLARWGERLRDRIGAGIAIGPSEDSARARQLGMGFARTAVMWDWSELSKGAREYDVSRYDQQFVQVQQAGLRLLAITSMVNLRYTNAGFQVTTPDGIAASAKFAGFCAARYKDYSPIWELGNEPNHPLFWKPAPDPAAYTLIATEQARAIRAADPNAQIAICSLSGAGVQARAFLKVCLDLGLGEWADYVSVHPYLNPPELALPEYSALKQLLAPYRGRRGRLRLMQSEWAYPAHTMDAETHAALSARIMLVDLLAGLDGTIYYRTSDAPPESTDEYDKNYGLLRASGALKPAAILIQNLLREIGDATSAQAMPVTPGAFVLRLRGGRGGDSLIGWTMGAPMSVSVEGVQISLTRTPRVL
jgi:polysaccharide biosynthesis protein PslG